MTRVPDRHEEAASWVNRLDQPAIDASLGPEFDRWMDASPDHSDAFADVQALWQSDALRQALQQSNATAETMAAPAPREGWSRFRSWTPTIAAMLCAAFVTVIMLFSGLSVTTYRTGAGGGEAIVLADGSHVDLSGDSELRVRILPWQRSATLVRGEAFFDIQHEQSRAFRVHSGSTSVRVLGTAFNVDRQSDTRTSVEVYRGAVEVDLAGTDPVVLRKGERTRVADGRIAARSPNVRKSPDWKSGWFEADDVPLGVLIAKVQRHSGRPIAVDDADLAALPISGRFQVSDPTRVLNAVRQAYGLDVRYDHEQIRITAARAEHRG
jgi:transmembrane sensor